MLFPAIFINVIQLTTKSLYFWDSLYLDECLKEPNFSASIKAGPTGWISFDLKHWIGLRLCQSLTWRSDSSLIFAL